ncbi:MAG: hypothetical protein JXR75_00245 [Rhodobacteraceae bacterium]|nr:hypothetical protein [Paracoccaceae bacterium]
MYSTGTITLTNGSATVTGAGTAWVGVLRTGWMILVPGEGPLLVSSVESATSLTLARAYQGTTRSGQVYNAVPTQGELAPFVSQLQALLDTVQTTIDGPGQGKFPDGSLVQPAVRFTADEDTGWRRVAANVMAFVTGGGDRLTLSSTGAVLNGLLTGTAVTQNPTDMTANRLLKVGDFGVGSSSPPLLNNIDRFDLAAGIYLVSAGTTLGTLPNESTTADVVMVLRPAANQTTQLLSMPNDGKTYIRKSMAAASWGPWRMLYDSKSILGAVSQAAGVPTGAVIERGSNANGNYVRLADGTQWCFRSMVASASAATSWVFPAAFAAVPVIKGTAVATVLSGVCLDANPTTTAASFSARDTANARRGDTCHLVALGSWF